MKTIEEKAKAYDEALERFKAFKEKYYTKDTVIGDAIFDKTGQMQKDFESIFPSEESEDERMLRTIIRGFESWKSNGHLTFNNTKVDDILAFLEKQEQKPGDKDRYMEGYMNGTNDALKEQNPAWSEEDNRLLDFWLDVIERNDWRMDENFCKASREFITRLKSLPERFNLQPKQEWSEEDEKMIDTIVSVLGQYIDYKPVSCTGSGCATSRYSKEIAWLKSLRPQPN